MDHPPLTLLLIDNDPAEAAALQAALAAGNGRNSLSLAWARTLDDGTRVLNDRQAEINAILLDLRLPEGGQAAFSGLLATTHLPIILYSVPEDEELASQMIHAGAQDFLVKGQATADLLARSVQYAIDRQRAALVLDERNREIQLLYEAGQALSRTLDLDRLYETFMHILLKAMKCDHLFISSYDSTTQMISCVFAMTEKVIFDASQLPPVPLEPEGQGKQSQVIRSGRPLMANNWQALNSINNYYIEDDGTIHTDNDLPEDAEITRSGIIVPIILQEQVTGAIQILSIQRNAYSENDLRIAEALAAQIAVAANNAILYQQARAEIKERKQAAILQEAVYRIAEAAHTTESLQDLYLQIHRRISDVMYAENFYIALADEDAGMLRFVYSVDENDTRTDRPFPLGKGLTAHVLNTGESLLISRKDCSDFEDGLFRQSSGTPCEVWLGVPLVARGLTIGMMAVQHYGDAKAYTKREQRILEYVSSQVATAIDRKLASEMLRKSLAELKLAQIELEALNHDLERRVEERTAEVRQSEAYLSAANAALKNASRMKDEFLASMSHELRTPLTGILGLSEVLQLQSYGPLNEKQLKALKNIENSGHHLLDLINDILDLSKIEAGKLDVNIAPCSVTEVCQASLQLVKGMAHQKQQSLSFSIHPPAIITTADERRLKQMLVNLLSNAVKFTPKGGRLGLEVEAREADQVILLCVWDKGIGIAPENLGKLFKPFIQLDSSLARQYSGTGLGLSLVQRMAELHGGNVMVESVLGEGSRFTVSLPWHRQAFASPADQSRPDPESLKNALVIEDNLLDAENITRYCTELGLASFTQPAIGGALAKAIELRPSAILLDLHLPDGSGLDLLAELKADERTRNIPVIVTSVNERRSEAAQLGAAGYLVKPFSLADLRAEMAKAAGPAGSTGPVLVIGERASAALVMMADDNELILETITAFLEARGFQAIATRSGFELLERAPQHHPDIILVDIQMPGMDGMEAIRRLRAHSDPEIASVPIIAVTALAMAGDREKFLEAGANDYISKPIALPVLAERIVQVLRQHKAPIVQT